MSMHTASRREGITTILAERQSTIVFENVSVRYRVPRERVSGIKEYTIRLLQRRLQYEEFWAVKDVSFNITRGEVFGIVGRNGAGKSTMLKVMARVLQPTKGRIVMYGHVAPLLELGGGFHQELTGRENVYLNMSLLGHSRRRTDELFDEIVDFAEIKDFIDSPIRTYSTGMVARLGFAVATCVRPDILLVDEVLSVGDTSFQEKCLARMFSFQEDGTTIVIVSHSMATVENFCDRALWLDQGQVRSVGAVSEVIDDYLNMNQPAYKSQNNHAEIQFIEAKDQKKDPGTQMDFTLLDENFTIYSVEEIFDPKHGSLTGWFRFRKSHPGRLCTLFHTDDSRYILYSTAENVAIQNKRIRKIIARAGGNRRVLDKRAGAFHYPEVSVEFEMMTDGSVHFPSNDLWHMVTMTWEGFPEGIVSMYIDGKPIGEREYNERYNDNRPLPEYFAVGMRPSTWKGEFIRDAEGGFVESRPHTTMSIDEGGLDLQAMRLYRRALTGSEIQAIWEKDRQTIKAI